MRDDSYKKPCIFFSAREIQPATKPTEAQVEEEKETRLFDPAPTAATEGWSTRPWPSSPLAEPTISFGGPVAEEASNPCYMFGMANDEESVEKALTACRPPLHLKPASTATSSPLWWTAELQVTISTTPSSTTSSTVCRTTFITLHLARFSLLGELCWTGRWKACCEAL